MAIRKAVKWISLAIGGMLLILVAAITLAMLLGVSINLDHIRDEVDAAATAALGREVAIEGAVSLLVSFQPSCGECMPCGRGHSASCTSVPPTSMYGVGPVAGDWGGAFADLVRVPFATTNMVALPGNVSPTQAASASDNLADAYRTVAAPLKEFAGGSVLVAGQNFADDPNVLVFVLVAAIIGLVLLGGIGGHGQDPRPAGWLRFAASAAARASRLSAPASARGRWR